MLVCLCQEDDEDLENSDAQENSTENSSFVLDFSKYDGSSAYVEFDIDKMTIDAQG